MPGDPEDPLKPPPDPPGGATITLGEFNTLYLDPAYGVYTLLAAERSGACTIRIANVGDGDVWIRKDADPAMGDIHSLLLPAGGSQKVPPVADVKISFYGQDGVRVVAADITTIVVQATS